MAFRNVAVYAPDGVTAFGLGVVSSVLARRPGAPDFTFWICGRRPGSVFTDLGLPLEVHHGPDGLACADLVFLLPGIGFRGDLTPELRAALRAAHAHGATLAAHCVGTFLLADTGLLDGRTATTHWQYAADLAAAYPAVTVRADALYVDEGDLVTGAGATAGLDLALHLVRRDHGAATAARIARDLVTPPHRDGGQAQYIAVPVPEPAADHRLDDLLTWARTHLDQRITVDGLAARALMSRRTFVRRFKDVTGGTPHAWLIDHRVRRAEELLETTDLPVEEIARQVGYSSAVLREQFVSRRGVPPRDYRRTFGRNE